MATKTLIRSKKPHEVKLVDGTQLAQSQQPLSGEEAPVPALIRKAGPSASTKAPARKKAAPPATPGVRAAKKAVAKAPSPAVAKKTKPAAKPAVKKAPSPRLPARVPADGLWESDSAVQQRLQALMERNAQLAEQLQKIQSNALPKGYKP